jgi:hypothetical protein
MCYVILSRITCLSQLYLLDFDPKKIYCNENAKKEAKSIKERALNKKITEWDLMKEDTIRVTTLNVRSLQKHSFQMTTYRRVISFVYKKLG